MNLKVYNDNRTINSYKIKKENFTDKSLTGKVSYIGSRSKEENILNLFKSYFSDAKSLLFDQSNKLLVEKLNTLDIPSFDQYSKQTIFDKYLFKFIYFTSGTTGQSVGALKTEENIQWEVKCLTELTKKYNIKRVIVTVPFIHIYGSVAGVFYPYFNDLDIILKEHFLPHDLLEMCDDNSLIVTTPLYIKALNRLQEKKDLSKSLFLSSTAPLDPKDAKDFNEKFQCDILQLFGSTETGGIAYKFNDESLWTPHESTQLSLNKENELKVTSPLVSNILYDDSFKQTDFTIQTFDYVEFEKNKFKIIGRSSQILKIAGKRYSTIQIENILEKQSQIDKALVFVKQQKNSLRGEVLDITLEAKEQMSVKDIKKILQTKLSNLKFSIELKYVDTIALSSIGKKLRV
jgi:acyl-coenzyme A synthetase/AMP-(fatty) acid ligase